MAARVAGQAEGKGSAPRPAALWRDLKAMQKRRMQATELFRRGVIPSEIAGQLRVTHQVVSEWREAWRRGLAGLRAAGPAARLRQLSTAQFEQGELPGIDGRSVCLHASSQWLRRTVPSGVGTRLSRNERAVRMVDEAIAESAERVATITRLARNSSSVPNRFAIERSNS